MISLDSASIRLGVIVDREICDWPFPLTHLQEPMTLPLRIPNLDRKPSNVMHHQHSPDGSLMIRSTG